MFHRTLVTSDDPATADVVPVRVNTRLADDIDKANTGVVGYDNYCIGSRSSSEEE